MSISGDMYTCVKLLYLSCSIPIHYKAVAALIFTATVYRVGSLSHYKLQNRFTAKMLENCCVLKLFFE
jgi:hypothetical protein